MSKISIRFFNDREVRAIWDDEHSKWFFSVLDIVGVLNDQSDYEKNRNYWKYLKAKLKKEKNQLVSATTQLKGKNIVQMFSIMRGLLRLPKYFRPAGRTALSSGSLTVTKPSTAKASRKRMLCLKVLSSTASKSAR